MILHLTYLRGFETPSQSGCLDASFAQLIFGGVYVLISNAFQPHKMAKKKLTDQAYL
jgi:hypothetical protein